MILFSRRLLVDTRVRLDHRNRTFEVPAKDEQSDLRLQSSIVDVLLSVIMRKMTRIVTLMYKTCVSKHKVIFDCETLDEKVYKRNGINAFWKARG